MVMKTSFLPYSSRVSLFFPHLDRDLSLRRGRFGMVAADSGGRVSSLVRFSYLFLSRALSSFSLPPPILSPSLSPSLPDDENAAVDLITSTILRRSRWEDLLLPPFSSSCTQSPSLLSLSFLRLLHLPSPLLPFRFLLFLSSHILPSPDFTLSPPSHNPSVDSFVLRIPLPLTPIAISVVISHLRLAPSLFTFHSLFRSSLRLLCTDILYRLHHLLPHAHDSTTVGFLVDALLMDNKPLDALCLLRDAASSNMTPELHVCTRLMDTFARGGNFGKVSELLHLMIASGCMPDRVTYQCVISGFCENGMMDEAVRIFEEIKNRGYNPDVVTYTTLINHLGQMGRVDDALALCTEMNANGIDPNEYTYNSVIGMYCKAGDFSNACKNYAAMLKNGFGESTVSCNVMLSGLCMHGWIEDALKCFEKMPKMGILPDVITFNTIIQWLCNGRRVAAAKEMYSLLLKSGLEPTVSTYTPIIEALVAEGNLIEATRMVASMQREGLDPLVPTRELVIKGFCKIGKPEEGLVCLVGMLECHLKPQDDTVNMLLESLTSSGHVDDALLVLNAVFKVGYILPNSVSYGLVNQLCGANIGCSLYVLDEISVKQ